MRDIILFTAVSIDGYIAKPDGNLDWLFEFDKTNNEADKIFEDFYDIIDTTFIGRKTYTEICKLEKREPYPEKRNFVFSREDHDDNGGITFIKKDLEKFALEQKKLNGKDIWLVGGGEINNVFLKADLIDKIILDIIPVVLGNGINLFKKEEIDHKFYTIESINQYPSGRIHTSYIRKRETIKRNKFLH